MPSEIKVCATHAKESAGDGEKRLSSSYSSTSETCDDSVSSDISDDGMSSISSNSRKDRFPRTGSSVVEEYLSRRNRRLEELKAHRLHRLEQLQSSVSAQVGSKTLISIDDHPYYLAQQERKLQALKLSSQPKKTTPDHSTKTETKNDTSGTRTSSSLHSPTIEDAVRDELVAAYQLIHRQRLRIQQLEKRPGAEMLPLNMNESLDNDSLIRKLQAQVVQLEHDKAQIQFHFTNRITHDAMRYDERISFFKTKAAYWQTRGQNTAEIHEREKNEAKLRIAELEKSLAEAKVNALERSASNDKGDLSGNTNLQSTRKEKSLTVPLPCSSTHSAGSNCKEQETRMSQTSSSASGAQTPGPSMPRCPWTQIDMPTEDDYSYSSTAVGPACPWSQSPVSDLMSSNHAKTSSPKNSAFANSPGRNDMEGTQADLLKNAMKKKMGSFSFFNNTSLLWEKAGSFRGVAKDQNENHASPNGRYHP